jgi:AraC-like DNA-binding protein
MGLLNIIRRMALREKLPLREIARRTGMSRNTVKKHLNTDSGSCPPLAQGVASGCAIGPSTTGDGRAHRS